jgi:hypothetical protein
MKNAYYKYRPLYQIGTNGHQEAHPFTKSIFQKAELWYSAPTDFNDPFDCKRSFESLEETWPNHQSLSTAD